jgi:hypothetical protein
MANTHWNGSDPIVMPASEYDRQAEIWKDSGGEIRDDHPHTGADYDHAHWYEPDNPNDDFVCVRQEDDSQESDSESSSDEEPTDDD